MSARTTRHGSADVDGQRRPPPDGAHKKDDVVGVDLHARDYVDIVKRSVKRVGADQLPDAAAAIAYYGFLAIPAVLLIAVGVFSLFASPSAIETIVERVGRVTPAGSGGPARKRTRPDCPGGRRPDRRPGRRSRRGLDGERRRQRGHARAEPRLRHGRVPRLRQAAAPRPDDGARRHRRVRARLRAARARPEASAWIGESVGAEDAVRWAWLLGEWPIRLVGLLVAFGAVLFLGPDVERPRWRFLTVGAGIAVALWLAASGGFAIYVSLFGSYNQTWGTLAAVIIMLTWLWLSALALLFAAEVDAETERTRQRASVDA